VNLWILITVERTFDLCIQSVLDRIHWKREPYVCVVRENTRRI
jgi:hypothetical protein